MRRRPQWEVEARIHVPSQKFGIRSRIFPAREVHAPAADQAEAEYAKDVGDVPPDKAELWWARAR
jgi:hypothetical protein